MQEIIPSDSSELLAAYLQGVVTIGLSLVFLVLYRAHRKRYFAWWSLAWMVYTLRVGAIVTFLSTGSFLWLYWHQVATGWSALTLLWAALVFSRQATWRVEYLGVALFPVLWSYLAIYQLDNFLLAAGPAVVFLSVATLWTAFTFARYARSISSGYAYFVAASFLFWGLHHLDYPFLRARGAWNPWGYYIDIVVVLAIGAGTLLLVHEDVVRGIKALTVMSAEPRYSAAGKALVKTIISRPLELPGVTGVALVVEDENGIRIGETVGESSQWSPELKATVLERLDPEPAPTNDDNPFAVDVPGYAFAAALPLTTGPSAISAMLIVGEIRDPFTALDAEYLFALGQQVSSALENAALYRELDERKDNLELLTKQIMEVHEAERERIGRELHDESAQVFAAVKLRLGLFKRRPADDAELDELIGMLDSGITGLRSVTSHLRPPLLDDLGLAPAVRELCRDFKESGMSVVEGVSDVPEMDKDRELALYRSLQEALSNVAKHSDATRVEVTLQLDATTVALRVSDNGSSTKSNEGGTGLESMRERIEGLGGTLAAGPAEHGFEVHARFALS